MSRIHVGEPRLVGNEERYVLEALRAGQLSQAAFVREFELSFAKYVGRRHALACANGTVALHLALLAIGLEPGDPVLVPTLTYVATANAVALAGGVPVLCDVDRSSWNIDPADARRRLEALRLVDRPAVGLLPVHLYGVPAPMGPLAALADEFHLWTLEDAAEAIGATYADVPAGALGLAATFSFYGNKTLSTGEGGMLVVDDDELARLAHLYRGQGQAPGRRYFHEVAGFNYRLGELAGAVGLAQLERVDWHVGERRRVARFYRERLEALRLARGLEWQQAPEHGVSGEWMFTVRIPDGFARETVAEHMLARDIETRPAFVCMHSLPMYRGGDYAGGFPVAEDLSRRGLSLPTHAGLTTEDLERVAAALEAALS